MKRKQAVIAAAAILFSGLSILPVKAEDSYQKQKDEVVMLVNEQRSAYGLPEFYESALLNQAAQIRAEEITQKFSHERPDGRRGITALADVGGVYWEIGENIAGGYPDEAAVVAGWMGSEGHRNNILNEGFNAIGIGICKVGNEIYWVQMFTDGRELEPLYTYGNINGDTAVNAQDAALVLTNAALTGAGNTEILSRMQKSYADVDHNNVVNALDAAGILKYAAYAGAGGEEDIETYLRK